MYQAYGRGIQRNRDNTFTVKVEFIDDRSGKQMKVEPYTVQTVPELKLRIKADLQSLKDADQDVTLTAAVVGVLLGEI